MATSSLVSDYIGAGTHAARPATPSVPTGCTALYYETDTLQAFAWNPATPAWVRIDGGGGGLTPPSIVQSGFAAGAGVLTGLTLGAAPTNGNLLVALVTNGSSGVTPSTGWNTAFLADPAGVLFSHCLWKIAGAGESATQSPAGSLSIIGMYELANATVGPNQDFFDATSTTGTSNVTAMGTSGLIIGVCINELATPLPTGITGVTLDGSAVGSANSVRGYHKTAPTKGIAANAVTPTFAASSRIKTISTYIGAA